MITNLSHAAPLQRRRGAIRKNGNVITADFGNEVRERNARWAADDARTRRRQLLDGALITALAAAMMAALVMGWPA